MDKLFFRSRLQHISVYKTVPQNVLSRAIARICSDAFSGVDSYVTTLRATMEITKKPIQFLQLLCDVWVARREHALETVGNSLIYNQP